MKRIITLLAIISITTAGFAQSTWTIDQAHSKIGFNVTHMVVSEVEGNFKQFEGKVTATSDDFNGADVEFTAQVASVDTDNERRDGHLRSDDFFSAEKFPTITFKGKLVKEGSKYQLKGKLTMRDVTKDVAFDVTYGGTVNTGRGMKAGFKLAGSLNRQDYGLKWANKLESGEFVVADEVEIECKLELNKA
ncbi:MAG TPA: YceI family protein [Cyclobacteriaceae bacterium]|nr:YceI family protein [Cyclobacteriaceae bacterium]